MVPFYALLSLWLSWHLNHKISEISGKSLWKEVLHWLSLMLAVYLVTLLVDIGIIGRVEAGFVVLILLAFSTLLAGLYIDRCFLLIGAVLSVFVTAAALVEAYLSVIMVPVILIAALILIWVVRQNHHNRNLG